MATPKEGYRTVDGKRVPSVTTILSRFKESGGLIHWSWKMAHEGLMEARALLVNPNPEAIERYLKLPIDTWDYRAQRDSAANAGTIAHEMVEHWIKGEDFPVDAPYDATLVKRARPAFEAFLRWAEQTKLKVIETEVSLVSHAWKFGGTRDAIVVDGRRAIGDWKTSNAIYPEYLCQLAAYGILDEEHGNTIDGGYHLLRFSKQEQPDDPVHFAHHYWDQLDVAREAFLRMRQLYDDMARLKRLAA